MTVILSAMGEKIAKFYSSISCFFLACMTSNCVARVLRISVLKFSSKLLISLHVMLPPKDFLSLGLASRPAGFSLILPLEHLMHKSIILL